MLREKSYTFVECEGLLAVGGEASQLRQCDVVGCRCIGRDRNPDLLQRSFPASPIKVTPSQNAKASLENLANPFKSFNIYLFDLSRFVRFLAIGDLISNISHTCEISIFLYANNNKSTAAL